jgi:ectoine hydroxylase-related dioxygenase (phytanoyl-CoA dioxygenase family)
MKQNVMHLKSHESLPMYALSEELAPRIEALGLSENIHEMETLGYTVVKDVAPMEFIDRLREAVRRHALEDKGTYFNLTEKGASCDMLLGRDPVFAEAVVNPKLLAIVEYMCGRGAIISQLSGSVRVQGSKAMALHADQDWMPAPFPEHNALMTGCWALEDLDQQAGSTKVIPHSHRLRRHPSPEEVVAEAGAIPIVAPKGSIAFWSGSVWHSNYSRELPGERVMLHSTFARLAYRPLEDYSHLGDDFIERFGPEMSTLLGRELWYGSRVRGKGGVDMKNYGWMRSAARR